MFYLFGNCWCFFRVIDVDLLWLWRCWFFNLLSGSYIFVGFIYFQSVFLCKLLEKLLILRSKVLELKLKGNILFFELIDSIHKFTGRIWNPICPFDDTFLCHPKKTRKDGFEFGQLLCFSIWASGIFNDCFFICFIYCDCDQDGEYVWLYLIYKRNIALFKCIFEILHLDIFTLTAYNLASAM